MFSKEAIATTVDEGKVRKKESKKVFPKQGFGIFSIKDCTFEMTEKDNYPKFKIQFLKDSKKDDFKPVPVSFTIDEGSVDKSGQIRGVVKLVSFLFNAFAYTLLEPDPEDVYGDILNQILKFKDKKFRSILTWNETRFANKIRPTKYWNLDMPRTVLLNDTSLNDNTPITKDMRGLVLSPMDLKIINGEMPAEGAKTMGKSKAGEDDAPNIEDAIEDDLPF